MDTLTLVLLLISVSVIGFFTGHSVGKRMGFEDGVSLMASILEHMGIKTEIHLNGEEEPEE